MIGFFASVDRIGFYQHLVNKQKNNANSTSEIYLFLKLVTIGDTAGEISISLSWYLVAGGIYYQHLVLKLDAGKMGMLKDKSQIVTARPLDQHISKTAALMECSQSAVVKSG